MEQLAKLREAKAAEAKAKAEEIKAEPIAAPSASTDSTSALDKYFRTTQQRKIMALIYGPPITGKTTGARTFPDPVIVDFDNNLPPDVANVVPMWDPKFIESLGYKSKCVKDVPYPNRRGALIKVLADLMATRPAGSTIIIDSLTRIESWYNLQEDNEAQPISAKTGNVDSQALWRTRLAWFDGLFNMCVASPQHIIFIAHQQQERDDKGNVVSQIRPALMGQIGEKLPGLFPYCMQAVRRKAGDKLEYVWRIKPGNWEPARVPKQDGPEFIPQTFSELLKVS